MQVGVVIPQRGRVDLTRVCIETLREHDGFAGPIVVVDDGSPAHELERWKRWALPGCVTLEQPARGVTAAWNRGWRWLPETTDVVVFLNNDVVTFGPWLAALCEPLRAGTADMTGAAWRTEREMPLWASGIWDEGCVLEGWNLAMRRELLCAQRGFDESLKLYFSDTELQLRVQAEGGELVCVPDLPIRHLGHATTRRLQDRRGQWRRDRARFVETLAAGLRESGCAEDNAR